MNRSTRLQLHVAPPMTSAEAALGTSQDPSFETARNDAHDDVSVSAWEAALDD